MRIGVDIGGTSIKVGLVNKENKIIARTSIETHRKETCENVCKELAKAILELLEENGFELHDCKGIGIGCPGTIDAAKGVVVYSNNIEWEDEPIVSLLKSFLGDVEIGVANDADAAALGEVCAGSANGEDSVLLTLGTGVGSGVIINRKIFTGSLLGGCELGHMTIKKDGLPCNCGRKGCLEVYASASALLRISKEKAEKYPDSVMHEMCGGDLDKITGKMPFDAAALGDAAGIETVKEYEENLAEGIASVINIFRPRKVILGGGVSAQKEVLTKPLQNMVKGLCFGGEVGQVSEIITSELGNDAGIIGAANLV